LNLDAWISRTWCLNGYGPAIRKYIPIIATDIRVIIPCLHEMSFIASYNKRLLMKEGAVTRYCHIISIKPKIEFPRISPPSPRVRCNSNFKQLNELTVTKA
jgi:hypothetical protein